MQFGTEKLHLKITFSLLSPLRLPPRVGTKLCLCDTIDSSRSVAIWMLNLLISIGGKLGYLIDFICTVDQKAILLVKTFLIGPKTHFASSINF